MAIPHNILIVESLFRPKTPAADMGNFQIHNMSVDVVPIGHGYSEIQLSIAVNDVHNPGRVIRVQSNSSCHDEVPLKHVVREAVLRLVIHEVDEWLRVNGELVTNAHAND